MLSQGRPLCLREIYEGLGEKPSRVECCLKRLWKKEIILRTKKPIFKFLRVHKGKAGLIGNVCAVNYFVINDGKADSGFVKYENKKKDGRDRGIKSKAKLILEFLEQNKDKAFYSKDVVEALNIKSMLWLT